VSRFVGVFVVGAALFGAPSFAQAEITQVFTDTSTPIDCEVQTGGAEGIRFCTNQAGEDRSTVDTFDGVPIDINVAFPPEPAPPAEDGNFPTVMMFHGYGGSKMGLTAMRRWVDQGYAVFTMTTRGFNQSCGTAAARAAGGAACDDGYVRLMDTRYEVRDAQDFIGLHHVHHLNARIPNYNLQAAHDEVDLFDSVPVLTFWDGIKATRLKLWDEERGKLVTFPEARRNARRTASEIPSATLS
jgi:hypothetical protein